MKSEMLRQALIRTAIICGVILLVSGIVFLLISMKDSDLAEKLAALRSEKIANDTQYSVVEKQIADANEARLYYENFKNSENSDPQNFRREYAKTLLAQLKERTGIVSLKFTMSQFEKLRGQYEKKYVATYNSLITIQFSANSDTDAYNLIKEICTSFPGNVEIQEYKVNRTAQIDNTLLIATSESGQPNGLVDGLVTLKWLGIQDNRDYQEEKPTQPPIPGPGAPVGPAGQGPVNPPIPTPNG